MRGLCTLGLAACIALGGAGHARTQTDPPPLRLAQGFDINELLKGGAPPEATAPDLPMRGLTASPEAAVETTVDALPPVAPFPPSALAGRWTGVGSACDDRQLEFQQSGDRYTAESTRVDPVDGYQVTTLFDATPGPALPGAAHPDDPSRFFSYARQFPARVTRRDGSGAVVDLVEDIAVTLLVSRDTDTLTLRIVEPVTECRFARPADPVN
ncbi:hypothetical protein [Antarctobacter heliothermus]|uniref:DUF1579 domain-containing protein n=1 Tax=Antarctobacter heliothermus TaxID=74033 RepID=A0A239EI00_9RHOB|nr:hypothetical protein [Antarctobacter heliothermus]SNS43514.1 hypothetical protein SAMN04488078_10158 [Antarctobacter heliothermus]